MIRQSQSLGGTGVASNGSKRAAAPPWSNYSDMETYHANLLIRSELSQEVDVCHLAIITHHIPPHGCIDKVHFQTSAAKICLGHASKLGLVVQTTDDPAIMLALI